MENISEIGIIKNSLPNVLYDWLTKTVVSTKAERVIEITIIR